MKRSLIVICLAVLFCAPLIAQASRVAIINDSDWTIMELYVAPINDDDWGEDQLRRDVIEPGDTFTLTGIPCDDWDIMVVDDENWECVIEDVDLCGDRAEWVITNRDLNACVEETEDY